MKNAIAYRTNGTKLNVYNGSEGPSFDPYGYCEITVERLGHRYELHSGLAVWVEVDGVREDLTGKDYDDGGFARFEELTGYGPDQWEKWYYKHIYFEDPMGSLGDYI